MSKKAHNTYIWAAAKAATLRQQASALATPIPGNGWRRARAREQTATDLLREAARFDRIAVRSSPTQ